MRSTFVLLSGEYGSGLKTSILEDGVGVSGDVTSSA